MITVLHIITGLRSGGAEGMLKRIALANPHCKTFRQIIVSLTDEGIHGAEIKAAGIKLYCLNMKRGRPSLLAFAKLIYFIRQMRPDIVMSWLYHADLLATLAAPLSGIKCLIWNIRCSNIEFSHYSPLTRWAVVILAKLSSFSPSVVAVNSRAGKHAHETLGYRPKKWVYLPNGFNLQQWQPDSSDRIKVRAELGLNENEIVVVMVARVDPQKDHSTFLVAAEKVLARHPSIRFVLIGKDTNTLTIPPILRNKFIALGEIKDITKLLRSFDIFVLSSAYGEGFPNAVGEAMATGLPCVVTDVGESAILVGDTGIVVPPRNSEALALAIGQMIDEGHEKRNLRGLKARQKIKENWSINDSVHLYHELWQNALNALE